MRLKHRVFLAAFLVVLLLAACVEGEEEEDDAKTSLATATQTSLRRWSVATPQPYHDEFRRWEPYLPAAVGKRLPLPTAGNGPDRYGKLGI